MESLETADPEADQQRRLSVTSRRLSVTSRVSRRSTIRMSVATMGHIPADLIQDELDASFDVGGEASEKPGMSVGLSFIEVIMNFTIACVGGSCATFPKVMSNTGYWVTPFLMMFAAGLCCECGVLICQSCDLAERINGLPLGSIRDYEGLSEAIGGRRAKLILMFSKNCAFVSFLVVFMIFIRDGVAKFFSGSVESGKQIIGKEVDENAGKPMIWIHFCIVLPLFIALAMLKDLKQLAKFGLLGVGAVAIQCISMIAESLRHYFDSEMCRAEMERDSWGNKVPSWVPLPGCLWYEPMFRHPSEDGEIFKTLSIFIFGFAILGTLPSVRSEMAQPDKLPSAFRVSFVVVLASYFIVMGTGYLGFGELVADNLIKSMNGFLAIMASICIIINLALTTPIFLICVFKTFEASGDDVLRTPFTIPNLIFRTVSMVLLAIVSHVVPYVLQIIGLASSIFCVFNNLIMPLTLYYWASRQEKSVKYGLRMVLHVVIILVALTVLVLGTMASCNTLVKKLSTNQEEIKRTPQTNGKSDIVIRDNETSS